MAELLARPWVSVMAWLMLLAGVAYHRRWSTSTDWLGPTRCTVDDLCTAPDASTHRVSALAVVVALAITLVGLRVLMISRMSSAVPVSNETRSHMASNAAVAVLVPVLCLGVLVPTYYFMFVAGMSGGPLAAGVVLLAAMLALARILGGVLHAHWGWCSKRRSAGWGFVMAVIAVLGSGVTLASSLGVVVGAPAPIVMTPGAGVW